MGCLVYGLVFLSHSGNDPVITAHCVKERRPYSMKHKKKIKKTMRNVSERLYDNFP